MDIAKTRAFYETLAPDYVCDCDYCKNYVKEIKRAYPLLADYLQSIGVDIEKPFETMPLEPDKDGYIDYLGVQYIVLGCKDDFEKVIVADMRIDITDSHPRTDVPDAHFVIELLPTGHFIRLRWTM